MKLSRARFLCLYRIIASEGLPTAKEDGIGWIGASVETMSVEGDGTAHPRGFEALQVDSE